MDHQTDHLLGLMSGTSCDGVDVAWIDTDGQGIVHPRGFFFYPYPDDLQESIRGVFGVRDRSDPTIRALEDRITRLQSDAVHAALGAFGVQASLFTAIGFHGQTITHDPAARLTLQLGSGSLMRDLTTIPVVYDFRSADVAAGGQGAPLIPIYHQALVRARKVLDPVAIVNIGGVANVTWIDPEHPDQMLAFDTGPGNALMDDYARHHLAIPFDADGRLAGTGVAHAQLVNEWLRHPYFTLPPPKSLDRGSYGAARDVAVWDVSACEELRPAEALATLSLFTARAVALAADHFPSPPAQWVICGGGRHNETLMKNIRAHIPAGTVINSDSWGWNGDAIEAQGFAYLAARVLRGLPISFPGTTGIKAPMTGGTIAS